MVVESDFGVGCYEGCGEVGVCCRFDEWNAEAQWILKGEIAGYGNNEWSAQGETNNRALGKVQCRSKKLDSKFVQKEKDEVKELQRSIFGTTKETHKGDFEATDLLDTHKKTDTPAVLSSLITSESHQRYYKYWRSVYWIMRDRVFKDHKSHFFKYSYISMNV